MAAFLIRRLIGIYQAVFVHDPISLDPFGCLALVEDQSFLYPKNLAATPRNRHRFIGPGGLPVPSPGGPVRSGTVGVLPVPRRVEIPLSAPIQSQLCSHKHTQEIKLGI